MKLFVICTTSIAVNKLLSYSQPDDYSQRLMKHMPPLEISVARYVERKGGVIVNTLCLLLLLFIVEYVGSVCEGNRRGEG